MTRRNYSETGFPDFVPLPTYLPLGEAKRRAWRAFWRGVVIGGLMTGAAFIGGAAWGGDRAEWDGTACQLVAVTGQAHVAEVHCRNQISTAVMRVWADLSIDGLTVQVVIAHVQGEEPDVFTVTPQDGYIADPQTLTLPEWSDGVFRIYPFAGA
jgi:hypothetical protein